MKSKNDVVKNKNLLVIGFGKTGISVIKKILNLDISSSIIGIDSNSDLNISKTFNDYQDISKNNLKIILGKDALLKRKILEKIDLIIVSPGVPGDIPIIKFAEEDKIPVWSELELAWKLLSKEEKRKTIAVTGTNGKTTVVTLIGKIFNDCGNDCTICGNIGLPLIDTVDIESKERDSPGS